MIYNLEQLKEQNAADAYRITAETLERVNGLIKAVEQSRTTTPQPLDDVDFITIYGEHTEHATIDSVSVSNNYKTTVCEHCTPEPVIMEGGTVTAFIGCGGAFYPYNADKMRYIGKFNKTCKIYCGDLIKGFYIVYFDCEVSRFSYDARS